MQADEAGVEVEVSQEAAAVASLHEGEAARGVVSHGDAVNYLYPGIASFLCRYLGVFGFVYQVFKWLLGIEIKLGQTRISYPG